MTARTESAEATRRLASALARLVRRGETVVLAGPLGSGKTTFAQGFARGLGIDGAVTSPTFTLVRQYPCELGQLVHADVYRLDDLAEVSDLALAELAAEGVALVEWGDVAVPALPPVTWTVVLAAERSSSQPAPAADHGKAVGSPDPDDEVRLVTITGDDDRRDAVQGAVVGVGRGSPEPSGESARPGPAPVPRPASGPAS